MSFTETTDDLYLAFDIFSYLTFCQSEAIGLQIFFENLLRTEDTQSMLQGVMNTMKLDYIDHGIERELQYIFAELKSLLDLRLPQLLATMMNSQRADNATAISNGYNNRAQKLKK